MGLDGYRKFWTRHGPGRGGSTISGGSGVANGLRFGLGVAGPRLMYPPPGLPTFSRANP